MNQIKLILENSGVPKELLDECEPISTRPSPLSPGYAGSNGASSGSNQSDSDQEDSKDHPTSRPPKPEPVPEISITPRTPTLLHDSPGSSSPPQSPHVAFNKTMSFFSNPADSPGSVTEPNTNGRLLWDFLQQLLNDSMQRYTNYIAWKNRESGVFKIVDPPGLAKLWGIQKNHLSMNYDKMSRALRYYYRVNILRKVQGERHCYQFLRNPSELKSIKNISLLRQQMSTSSGNSNPSTPTTPTFPSPFASSPTVKSEPLECDYVDEPTDLSTGNSREAYLRDRENQRRDRDSRESYLGDQNKQKWEESESSGNTIKF
ncbi:ets DNA-binding protein pokkuri-like [Diaphorina citri]|uniref:Ets DNA-binding protein pokkuri-like n=1 Tax=Diaphorina citri TaxID=121845 RepID=A0A3Q0J5K0_DIACI|nr:ets DNA-binding protein pokkuri-like [Diaphorina citri]